MSHAFTISLIILVILEILLIIRIVKAKEYNKFFWFCELSPILVMIGLVSGNIQFIKGIINVGLLPQFFTLVVLVMVLVFDFKTKNFKGLKKKGAFYIVVSFLLHLISINLALYITLQTKAKPISLVYGTAILICLFILSYFFTEHRHNINFIDSADFISFKPKFYKFLWFLIAFLFLILPTYFLQNWIVGFFLK